MSARNHVPYLEDPSKPLNSKEALTSVGMSRDHGIFEFSLNNDCNHWAAAAATHEPDDDVDWDAVVGRQNGKLVDDIGEADTESNDSEDVHPDDDFEGIDDNCIKMEYVREGTFRRFPTTTKAGPEWESVSHRLTVDADTGNILEDIHIDCRVDPGLWRALPRHTLRVKGKFLLCGILL